MMPSIVENVRSEILKESSIRSSKVEETQPEIKEEKKVEGPVLHKGYLCDGCEKEIEGIRYKCAVCADFDFCEACEDKNVHDHPFLKIRHPRLAPLKIITILEDNQDSLEFNGQRVQIPGLQHGIQMAQQFFQNMQAGQCQRPQQSPCGNGNRRQENVQNFFKNMMGQCQKKQEEKKEEPKVEKKEEVKVEKVEVVEPKKEEKPVEPVIIEERKPEKKVEPVDLENQTIDSANHLSDLLDINFQRCYKFAKKNPTLSKEQLIELYFSDPRKL